MKKYAYIILIHKNLDYAIENIYKIIEELKDIFYIDIWVIYDDLHFNVSELKNVNTFGFNYELLKEKYNDKMYKYEFISFRGNSIFPIFYFLETHKYKKYIIQEYDCVYYGNYKELLNKINILDNPYDIIFSSEFEDCNSEWIWADKIKSNYNLDTLYTNLKHCLFNFFIISYDLLNNIYNDIYNKNYNGHYECVITSYVINNNIKYKSLVDYNINTYCKHYNLTRFELSNNIKYPSLIHPIKYIGQLNLIKKHKKRSKS